MVWGADVPADDWHKLGPREVARRAVQRLEYKGKGILLLHDIHQRTVEALPLILEELKERGFRIVHVVPASAERPATVTAASDWRPGSRPTPARFNGAAQRAPAEKDRRGIVLAERRRRRKRPAGAGWPAASMQNGSCMLEQHAGRSRSSLATTTNPPKTNLAKTNARQDNRQRNLRQDHTPSHQARQTAKTASRDAAAQHPLHPLIAASARGSSFAAGPRPD